jgi:lantibiotic modifying enzyme
MTWGPILTGGAAQRALDIVEDIALAVRDTPTMQAPGLMGSAGVALFLAYAESAGIAVDLRVHERLVESIEMAFAARLPIGLWTGCAGLRWTIRHLVEGDDADAAMSRLDSAVTDVLRSAATPLHYDVYSGLAGVLLAYVDDAYVAG